jgi:hypothetical protein
MMTKAELLDLRFYVPPNRSAEALASLLDISAQLSDMEALELPHLLDDDYLSFGEHLLNKPDELTPETVQLYAIGNMFAMRGALKRAVSKDELFKLCKKIAAKYPDSWPTSYTEKKDQ